MTIQKIKSGRVITVNADQFIGEKGTVFYNEALGDLRLSDGVTLGGIPLSGTVSYNTLTNELTYYTGADVTGTIITIGGTGGSITVSNIDATNAYANTVTNVTGIRFDTDSGFDVTDLGSGEVKIAMNSTFKYWEVDGALGLTAEGLDTVNFIQGPGVSIVTDQNSSTKSITFSVTATSMLGSNFDGGSPSSSYGGISSIDAGGVI
jgi:hypothetical protein